MKKIMALMFCFSVHTASAAMTKEFVVTRLNFNQEKNEYQVDFKNQAGVYRATGPAVVNCLQESLREKKAVKIVFKPMGLMIMECAKVSTK